MFGSILYAVTSLFYWTFWFFAFPMKKFLNNRHRSSHQIKERSPEDPIASESKDEKKRKEPEWKKYSQMPVNEKRKHYRCGQNYVTVDEVLTWEQYWKDNSYHFSQKLSGKKPEKAIFTINESLNNKVSLWRGDITVLEIDAIVNAANSTLLGGGGVDGCIHRAAGSTLRKECETLDGCVTGNAKITSGHKLPAKYVIHTVGPVGEKKDKLKDCYWNCLKLVKEYNIKTVAFCCISTGIYGYPNYSAAVVALDTVRRWLESNGNADQVERIIFCTFLPIDVDIYENLLPRYFPSSFEIAKNDQSKQDKEDEEDKHKTEEGDISKGIPVPPTEEELLCENKTNTNEKSMETKSKEIEKDEHKLKADPPKS